MATEKYTTRNLGIDHHVTCELRRGRYPRAWTRTVIASLTITYGVLTACDPMLPGPTRFGSDGLVRVTVEVPLQGGIGWLQQVLTWNSDGAWKLFEEIGYDSVVGDDNVMRNPGLPYLYAANYASLLQLAIDNDGTKLVDLPGMDPGTDCGIERSRVSILIRDNPRDEEKEWSRCAFSANALANLTTEGFEPDDGTARVVQIALRARDLSLGADFERYAYTGSMPFATIERGTQSGWAFQDTVTVTVYRSAADGDTGVAPEGWRHFWEEHTGGDRPAPEIDWTREVVIVVAIGERDELGFSVEVRRVLQIGDESRVTGTKIETVELVPGDYCAPARRFIWPYHIVVAPRGHPQPSYSNWVESIPCEA